MSRQSRLPGLGLLGAGAVACVACCAVPLVAVLGGLGVLSLVGSFWLPALAVLALVALLGAWALHQRRRRGTCESQVADLGMPGFQSEDPATSTRAQPDPELDSTGGTR
jgi:mercuric ion transport protein